jgi:RNA polymerase subunit RPABC4/transcription elongation factor Spt4
VSIAKCANCGAVVPAGSRYCPECGRPVEGASAETAVLDEQTSESAAPAPPRRWHRPVGVARARMGATFESVAVHAKARIVLFRLQREFQRLERARGDRFRELGEAVYRRNEAAEETARAALRELDEAAQAIEQEASALVAQAGERMRAAKLSGQPTTQDPGASGSKPLTRSDRDDPQQES